MNLILGGTHGLGREIALALHSEGEETFVAGRSYDSATHGPGQALDLTDTEQVNEFAAKVSKMSLKGFYWVAGFGYIGDYAAQKNVGEMVAVNFANVMPIAHAAWRNLIDSSNSSRYVVISSSTGVKARKDEAVYAATKYAQVGFARSLGLESERLQTKVKVSLFLPGGMRTPFWDGARPEAYENFLDPGKVAARVVSQVRSQSDYFLEDTIERGKL